MREIALIGLAQTLFFSLLIATKRKKEIKDYLLVIFMLFVGAELIYRYLLNSIPESDNKWITLFDISYWALFGPVTLMYILFTINKVKKLKAVHLFHLIPIVIGLYAIKDFFFINVEYNSFIHYFIVSKGLTKVALYLWEFISPVYIVYSIFVLIDHKILVKSYFSNISKKDFKWLSILLSCFIIYILISYTIWFIEVVFPVTISYSSLEILPAILTLYVFFLGYYGYKQAGIFFDYPVNTVGLIRENYRNSDDKYIKSGLNDSERQELIIRLKEIMQTEKPYLENELNINVLAKMLDTSFHKLSQVINESFHQNFYDFINYYRIEESKQLLNKVEGEKYTIISIAFDCGFSSKSSFYNAFKKNTTITPGEYLKKNKSSRSKVLIN